MSSEGRQLQPTNHNHFGIEDSSSCVRDLHESQSKEPLLTPHTEEQCTKNNLGFSKYDDLESSPELTPLVVHLPQTNNSVSKYPFIVKLSASRSPSNRSVVSSQLSLENSCVDVTMADSSAQTCSVTKDDKKSDLQQSADCAKHCDMCNRTPNGSIKSSNHRNSGKTFNGLKNSNNNNM